MPHLTQELRGWLATTRSIEQDLSVIQGALDLDAAPWPPEQLLEWVTSIQARVTELNHQLAGRVQAFLLICDDLERPTPTPPGVPRPGSCT